MQSYISLDLKPSFNIIYNISPSPWSSTFSRNFDDLLKKSVKCFDLTKDSSSSWFNSENKKKKYSEFLWFVNRLYFTFFSCVILVEVNQFIFTIPRFIYGLCYQVIVFKVHIELTYHKFKLMNRSHGQFNFFANWIIFFQFSMSLLRIMVLKKDWLVDYVPISFSSS